MCGIAGLFHLTPGARADARDGQAVRRMTGRLAHRGPDGEGHLLDGPAALGHRRLAIIDLAGGAQPMVSSSGRSAVVFNGEIYNHLRLRRTLPEARFRTASDTECLLELYEREGIACLDRLNGMFAFALHDRGNGMLHLVRDRFGVKPLYYAVDAGRLLFASELSSLLPALGVPPRRSPAALACYLRFGYCAGPGTIYEGIRKLPPGHRLEARNGRVAVRRWYAPAPSAPDPRRDAGRLLALLEDAVRLRLIADVPVGAFLSGGIDSAAICALVARAGGAAKAFTVAFPGSGCDEGDAARDTAARLGLDHEILPGERLEPADLRDAARFLDEPLADPSFLPTRLVCRAARRRVTVALSGDGADELFAGYERYLFARLAHYARRFPGRAALALAARALRVTADRLPGRFPLRRALRALTDAARTGDPYPGAVAYLSGETVRRALPEAPPPDPYALLDAPHASAESHLRAVLEEDFAWYLPHDILMKLDRASMSASLEARTPFLDYRVVEFARGLDATVRMPGLKPKAYLKQALAPLLPATILARPKRGFAVPLDDWTAASHHAEFADDLLAADSLARDLLGEPALRGMLDGQRTGRRNAAFALYNLYALNAWDRAAGKRERPEG